MVLGTWWCLLHAADVGSAPALDGRGTMSDTTEDAVLLERVTKTYPGVEQSLRGARLEWRGPALWLSNLVGVTRLTSNKAPPVQALHDLSLRIQPGEIFGLVGPNGSGKTTLMKLVAGLLQPTHGTGSVAGTCLSNTREIRRKVSYVSTTGWMGLEWPLTAEENIRFFATLCGMPTSLARVRTEEALHAVNLWEDRQKYPSQLSNGMRQRVILARALLFHTQLILLDEPTVGLDPVHTQVLLDLLRGRLRSHGQTIVLTDHQAAEMEVVADRIAVLDAGELVMLGTPGGLRAALKEMTVIEVHTEEMDLPTTLPPSLVLAAEHIERPGALAVRTWRVYARKSSEALQTVLDWIVQPTGRVVFLAETAPNLQDVLVLPHAPHGEATSGQDESAHAHRKARL
jgi:ABC-2 type transport system ATP-binding protein